MAGPEYFSQRRQGQHPGATFSRRQTIHEFAHILDYHGIQGVYDDPNNFWSYLKELRDEIFKVPFAYDHKRPSVPAGYLDVYSTANAAENFAQHFMYYILYGWSSEKKPKTTNSCKKSMTFLKEIFLIIWNTACEKMF